nr:MAG TPA_asm: hypothetical protein [Caudoviricetes sp.]
MPNPILFDQLTKSPIYNLSKLFQTNHQKMLHLKNPIH